MNKVFRVVRNSATGLWTAVSENAKGHRKSAAGTLASAILATLMAPILGAEAAALPTYNPADNDDKFGSTVIRDGVTDTLSGPVSNIALGLFDGGNTPTTYQDLLDAGRIVSGAEWIGAARVSVDALTKTVLIPDRVSGGTSTIAVHDSAKLVALSAITGATSVGVVKGVGDQQYIDMRLGTVDASGGTLNVNLGDSSQAVTSAANSLQNLAAKQSSLFYVDGSGAGRSELNWTSKNIIGLRANQTTASGTAGSSVTGVATFGGTFTAFDGSQRTVANVEDQRAYNDWLIAQLQSGALAADRYTAEFNKGLTTAAQTIVVNAAPAAGDELLIAPGTNVLVEVSGAKATGHIAQGAALIGAQNQITYVMSARQGGHLVNDGIVGHSGTGVSTVLNATGSGSQVENNGVLNAGFVQNEDGSIDSTGGSRVIGVEASSSATATNSGVINVATAGSTGGGVSVGIQASSGAFVRNDGNINIGVNGTGGGQGSFGVDVRDSRFTNNGEIYLGRGPQLQNSDAVEEVALSSNSANSLVGIRSYWGGNTSVVENAGDITIGSRTQNAVGIYSKTASRITNSGTINVNGAVDGDPRLNVGMLAVEGAANLSNTGFINLNGINGVGLKAVVSPEAIGSTASIRNSGIVNVAGGLASNGLGNYGIWSEGAGAKVDIAGGAVNLKGDGAIGARAERGGNITVSGGTVHFDSGKQQYGFIASGRGSSVDINSASAAGLDVSTEGSTLFRIQDGAKINNNAAVKLIASGKNSTALQVTGEGSTANLDALDITVSGDGATALKVEGGATGQMSGSAKLALKDGTTAVVVDNTRYDLAGNAVGAAQSVFTNLANFSVEAARDVTAFVVKSGAELVNAGDIHLSHGTAIEVVGSGSMVTADASGKRGKITVDDGKAGIFVHDGASLTTNDQITVDNSASGVLVGADAGRVVIGPDAHITGKGSSYGNLVTNQSGNGNVLVDGATLEMQGSGAALLSESNLDASSHGHVIVSSQVGGKGIALSGADGSMTGSDLVLGPNWTIDVTGNGAGVYTNTTGDLMLDGSKVSISGTGVGINADAAGQVHIAGDTRITASNVDAVLITGNPTSLINEGTLQASSNTATAIRLGAGDVSLANVNGGRITGAVDLGAGNDTVLLEDSVLDGALLLGDGNDSVTVRGNDVSHGLIDGGVGGNDQLIFDSHDYVADASNIDQLRNFQRVDLWNSRLDLQRDFFLGDYNNGDGVLSVGEGSQLASSGTHTVHGSVDNSGLITLANGAAGDTLTVSGNYVGRNGLLELDTELGDDNSASDKLVVKGDSAGSTQVKINATADSGAYTQKDGIQVVQVDGKSDGLFALSNRVVAGAREYLLVQGGKANPANGNWYLRSENPNPQPDPVIDPQPETVVDPAIDPQPEPVVDPVVEPQPEPAVDPVVDPQPEPVVDPIVDPRSEKVVTPTAESQPRSTAEPTPVYRPEIGAYLGNQLAAVSMFQHTLHDRLGEVDFTERQRSEGNGKEHQAVWTRMVGRGFDSATGADQVHSKTHTQLMQLGAELGQWTDGDSRTHFGVMAGAGSADTQVSSKLIGAKAKGKVDGYSVGVYGTWFADASSPTGLYLDSWAQYGWYDNSVRGDGLSKETYKSKTLSGSAEVGYAMELGRSDKHAWYLEPQAQVILSRYSADNHKEGNGTEVKVEQGTGVTTRLGGRAYARPLDSSKKRLQPFVETNWWHNGKSQSMSFSGETQGANLASDVYELKVGAQAELIKGWTAYGHVGGQKARGDQTQAEAQLGIKYSW